MDDPEHAAYRALTNRSFTPRAMRLLEDHIAELSRTYAGDLSTGTIAEISRSESGASRPEA